MSTILVREGALALRLLASLGAVSLGPSAIAQERPADEEAPATQVQPLDLATDGGAAPGAPVVARTGWSVQGMPLFNYSSDTGVGGGAAVMLVDHADGSYAPYRSSIFLQFFMTTRGLAAHLLSLDAPSFLHSSWRLGLALGYQRSKFTPYYGLGNSSQYVERYDTCGDRDALKANAGVCPGNGDFRGLRYYSYDLESLPLVNLNVRRQIRGHFSLLLGYRLRLERVRSLYGPEDLGQNRDSKLVEDARAGLLTGFEGPSTQPISQRTAELTAGLIYDSRDNEAAPTSGMYHELAARVAAVPLGSAFTYWGASLHLRGFYAPIPGYRNLVLTARAIVDVMGGEVPFGRLAMFGGLDGTEGIGGVSTARGIVQNRFQGPAKLALNAEARWTAVSFCVLGQTIDLTAVGFFDAGRAWESLAFNEGGGLKSSAGGGVHVAWNRDFLVRFDYGFGLSEPTRGFYIELGQIF